jgi:uncharacterized protein (DUF433 family)
MSEKSARQTPPSKPPNATNANGEDIVVRTERGLTIRGTRITLYSIMDYVHADWPKDEIKHWMRLDDEQIDGALAYIHAHRNEVEREYQEVLKLAEESRRYWEEYNRNRPKPPPLPDTPERAAVRAKIAEMKRKLGME